MFFHQAIAMANGAMDTNLDRVIAALAEISNAELHALIAATYKASQIAPGLLAWIDGAAERPLTGADPDRPELADSCR